VFSSSTDDDVIQKHSDIFSAMVYTAHVLPLAVTSLNLEQLVLSGDFHKKWTLNGWNDGIVQPARDAVLEYYKVTI